MTAKNPQKQERILEGGGIFLAGQNIYPCHMQRSKRHNDAGVCCMCDGKDGWKDQECE